jgi:mono/diheme cytochrome c family protein
MKRSAALILISTALVALLATGCSDSGNNTGSENTTEFDGYQSWQQVEYTNTPSAFLGDAHAGNDPEYVRRIRSSSGSVLLAVDGDYSVGDAFVKETYTFDATGARQWAAMGPLLGMVKRAAGYDTAAGDWEFFMLDPATGETLDSGADLNGGSCKGCHMSAVGGDGNDHIFTHPYEFTAATGAFDDYASWHLVDSEQGSDPFLGEAHAGNDADAVRSIYRKQLAANPQDTEWGYPIGTMIVKEVRDVDQNIIGMTAMTKRGAGFDDVNGDWEWFVLDNADFSIMARGTGAEVMGGMCVGCHNSANSAGAGADYVFAHDGDPHNH